MRILIKCFCLFSLLICCSRSFSSANDIERKYIRSVFAIETYVNHPDNTFWGTGFVIASFDNKNGAHDYHILTNAHVVDDKEFEELGWRVQSQDNKLSVKAELLGVDHLTDVAILKVTIADAELQKFWGISTLPVIPWGTASSVQVQDAVVSIGNTLGSGIVTHLGRVNSPRKGTDDYELPVMQTDAATNKGNSGSPIFNLKGELIGLHFEGDRDSGALVGYEVPVDRVKISYQNMLNRAETKDACYGYWGVIFRPMKPELQQYYFGERSDQSGVQISQVFDGSPAEKAGIKAGDVLLVADKIYNSEMLYLVNQRIVDSRKGDKVSLQILRDKKLQTVELIADERSYGRPEAYHTNRNFTVSDLRWIYRERNGILVQGVLAIFDNKDQKWMFSDMRKDCVIVSVNGVQTSDVKTFQGEWERAMTDKQPNIVLSVYQAPNDYNWYDGGVGNVQQVVVRK